MSPFRPSRELKQEGFLLAGRLNRIGLSLAAGASNLSRFAEKALELLTGAHTKAAQLGRQHAGDDAPEHPRDAHIGRRRAMEQMEYAQGFGEDLQAGKYRDKSEGGKGLLMQQTRALLYGKALTGTANEAWAVTKEVLTGGEARARWILGTGEHCPDCLEESRQGWRPISDFGRWPGSGDTRCGNNCGCHVETEDGDRGFSNAY